MNQNRRERPAINEIASDANIVAVRLAHQHVELVVETHEADVVARLGAFLHGAGNCLELPAFFLVARIAAERAINRSSSRRTSSILSCFLTLNSETRTPRRGSTVTSPSRASAEGPRAPACVRCPAFPRALLGEHLARLEPQGADHLLERDVGLIREAAVGVLADLRRNGPFSVVQVRLQ